MIHAISESIVSMFEAKMRPCVAHYFNEYSVDWNPTIQTTISGAYQGFQVGGGGGTQPTASRIEILVGGIV